MENKNNEDDVRSYASMMRVSEATPDEIEVGATVDDSELQAARLTMVGRAEENGADADTTTALRRLLDNFPNLFRVRLGTDPPAKVTPMQILIKPGARPRRCRPRRYPPLHYDFLRGFIRELETNGYVYRNIQSRYT